MRCINFKRSCEQRQWLAIMLAMFCICGFHSAQAELKVSEKFEYYTIKAETKSQLRKALYDAAVHVREDGFRAHGNASTDMDWQFYTKVKSGRCYLDRISVNLNMIYTMPKLITSNASIRSDWDNKGYAQLLKHEKGHGKLSKLIAEDINELLYSMGSASSCEKLVQSANEQANELFKSCAAPIFITIKKPNTV